MRRIFFIGMPYCGACEQIRRSVVEPLVARRPQQVRVLTRWCPDMARIDGRRPITRVPLFVVEMDGAEEFRFSLWPDKGLLEGIIDSNADHLTFEEVFG